MGPHLPAFLFRMNSNPSLLMGPIAGPGLGNSEVQNHPLRGGSQLIRSGKRLSKAPIILLASRGFFSAMIVALMVSPGKPMSAIIQGAVRSIR